MSVEDGATVVQREAGQASWVAQPLPGSSAYVYFQVDDSFKWATSMNATVTVEYLDAAPGRLGVEFDGEDQTAPLQGAYSRVEKIELKGDRNWKTAVFRVRQASFTGRQNGGADFRLVAETPGFAVRKVTLERN